MLRYLLRRLKLLLPTVMGSTLMVFAVMALAPGSSCVSENPDPLARRQEIAECKAKHCFNHHPVIQYLIWLNRISPVGFAISSRCEVGAFTIAKGMDLGQSSRYSQPVTQLLAERIPVTLALNLLSLPLIYIIAIWVGIKAAAARGGRFDVASNISMLALYAVPSILAGTLLLIFFTDKKYLGWFPSGGLMSEDAVDWPLLPYITANGVHHGYILDRLWHLVLPVVCLSYVGFAFLAKLVRSSVLENLQANYARTAHAKGLTKDAVLWRHVWRNSLLSLITVSGTLLPSLLSGALIIETIFSINGMGQLAIEAVNFRDRDVVLGITLITVFLTLLGRLIADVLYVVADPRVTYD